MAIGGTRVVVGAYRDDTATNDAGSAYVYDLTSARPSVPVVTLTNPRPSEGDLFGSAVALSGTRVVVGAPFNDIGASSSGSAYVYDLAGATPTVPVVTLSNPSPAASDNFGHSVAISGTRVVVGALHGDTGVLYAGSAYVYDLASATPTEPITTLNKARPATGDNFGGSVAVDGITVVVGVPLDDAIAPNRGTAYVFAVGPTLRIVHSTAEFATLSWTPASPSGFLLQYSGNLAHTDWQDAPSGATNPVMVVATNQSRFYQLRSP